MEINEAELAMKAKNRRNNIQGQHFEGEILAGCRFYEHRGIALIEKTPEPFRVLKKERNGLFTGRFTAHAQPDFKGTLKNGQAIVFEAKATTKDKIERNVLTDTQISTLRKHHELGAVAGVCVSINYECFFVPFEVWDEMKDIYGRKYIKAADIQDYKSSYDGAVHFLDQIEGTILFD